MTEDCRTIWEDCDWGERLVGPAGGTDGGDRR